MVTPSVPLPGAYARLTPGTQRAYLALLHQIATLPHGTSCTRQDDGLDWLDPHPDHQDQAAARCAGCPALTACAAYLRGNRNMAGVWAGSAEYRRTTRTARYRATRARTLAQQAKGGR